MTITINWARLASDLGFRSVHRMWTELYVEQRLSYKDLAERFAVSVNSVRFALAEAGIPPRKRGGPNFVGKKLPPEFLETVEKEGVVAAAVRFDIAKSTAYKRLYRLRQAQRQEAERLAASTQDPKEEERHEESPETPTR